MIARALVYLVDDDDAIRDSLAVLLETEGYQTQGFASGRAFLDGFDPRRAGCLLADLRLPDMSGLELQDQLAARGVRMPTVMITGHADVPVAVRAMKAGALDFIEKPFADAVILDAVRRAAAAAGDPGAADAAARFEGLSAREREVLHWLVQGRPNKVIAYELGISARTVEIHRARIMEKTGAGSLAHLVRLALAAGVATTA